VAELDRLAWGCLFPSFHGPERPDWLRPMVDGGLGGIVLFASNVRGREQLRGLTAALREDRPSLLVAMDEEGGDVTRLEAAEGSSYPGALALGYVDDPELTSAVAGAIAADLASVGANLNLAPVADVNTNPQNPVIGVRSFGSDPELVARHVAAHVAGTQAVGVAACAKHFPGHGDTRVDSHLELPVVERVELAPFRAAVGAGVRTVMTGHLLVPALDDSPATLSRVLVEESLRGELGFKGAVISDALDMQAIAATVGVEDGAVRALTAGVDAVCLGPTLGREAIAGVHSAVVEAVRSRRLAEERLAEAVGRVRAVADWARPATTDPGDRSLGAAAAARALRVEGDVRAGDQPVVVELRPEPLVAAGETGASLARVLGVPAHESANGLPTGRVVIALRDAVRHPWQQRTAEQLLAERPDAIVVETGLPGWRPDQPAALIETHGAGRASLEAAAALLVAVP
jgi:beta-glucosidase-like glycosyl hydrolase